jgi:hypothetical protein
VIDWNRDDGLTHQIFSAGDSAGLVSLVAGSSKWYKASLTGYFLARPEPAPAQPAESYALALLPKTWVPDSWHDIVLTWNEKEQILTVDGESAAPVALGKALPKAFNGQINFGNHPSLKDPGRTAIEELHIYPRVLTPEEVRQRYELFKSLLKK